MAAVGEIRVNTAVDNSGATRDLGELRSNLSRFGKNCAASFNRAFGNPKVVARVQQQLRENAIAISSVIQKMTEVERAAEDSDTATSKAYEKARIQLEQTEQEISRIQERMFEISSSDSKDALSKAFETAKLRVEQTGIEMDDIARKIEQRLAILAKRAENDSFGNYDKEKLLYDEYSKTDKALQSLINRSNTLDIQQQKQRLAQQAAQQEAVRAASVQGEEYKKLGEKLDQLSAKRNKFAQLAETEKEAAVKSAGTQSAEYKKLETQLERLTVKQEQLSSRTSGSAMDSTISAALGAASQVSRVASLVQRAIGIIQQAGEAIRKAIDKVTETLDTMVEPIKKATVAFGKLLVKMFTFNIFSKKANQQASGLAKTFIRLRTILSAMVIRKAINAAISAIQEGIQNLAKYSKEINAVMSDLKTETTYFKNNIVAAFAPILTYVVPIIQQLVSWINVAIAAIGQLLAALTGSNTYIRAIKQNQDYAGSLDDIASSAKDVDKAMNKLSIDELNTFSDNSSAGGGGAGGAAGPIFEEAEIDSFFKNLAERFKKFLNPIKKMWAKYADQFKAVWAKAFNSVKLAVKEIFDTFLAVWDSPVGERFIENILLLLMEVARWIDIIASAWRKAWSNKGEALVKSFLNMLSDIADLILVISDNFADAWDNHGVQIIEHLLQIFTNIYDTVGNIAQRLREAWEENEVGTSIANTLLDIVKKIAGFFEKITEYTKEWAETLDFGPMLSAINGLLIEADGLLGEVLDIIAEIYKDYVLPLISKLVEEVIPKKIEQIRVIIQFIREHLDEILAIVKLIVIVWLVWKAITFVGKIVEFAMMLIKIWLIYTAAVSVVKTFNMWLKVVNKIATALGILSDEQSEKLTNFSNVIDQVPDGFKVLGYAGELAFDLIGASADGASTDVTGATGDMVGGLQDVLTQAVNTNETIRSESALTAGVVSEDAQHIGVAFGGAYSGVETDVSATNKTTVKDSEAWYKKMVDNVIDPLDSEYEELYGDVFNYSADSLSDTMDEYNKAPAWFEDSVADPMVLTVQTSIDQVKGFFDEMQQAFKTTANAIIGYTNGMMGGIAKAINLAAEGLNSLSVEFPDWVPDVGGKKFKVNIPKISAPSIPMLAKGAVIPANREFLAVLGDQTSGRNLEAPEALIRQIVREESGSNITMEIIQRAVSAAIQTNAGVFGVSIGDRAISRASDKGRQRRGQSYGGAVFADVR